MREQDIPPISGEEQKILSLVSQTNDLTSRKSRLDLKNIQSTFACALHMHQPTIPAGKDGKFISHLEYMFENINEGDNHNAEPFAECYKRLAEIIPELIKKGYNPRIMLDYSGNLLWGIEQMNRKDILSSLKLLTCDEAIQPHVEWLGTFWSHAVASSTPIEDFKLQILAWQQHYFSMFGEQALKRVKGFSLPEMHLPNHPDTLYELITALNECGYRWLLVQEHTVENLDGSTLIDDQKYIPNIIQARNSNNEIATIVALIKTQGSDTKLVGQMQPYYEALGLNRQSLGTRIAPSIVVQIADGENGGVMMNEFPQAFIEAYKKIGLKGNDISTAPINGTEYLDLLDNIGIKSEHFPVIQAAHQHKLWQKIGDSISAKSIDKGIKELTFSDQSFSMTGNSWTNDLDWEEGYKNVLEPIRLLSSKFHKKFTPLVNKDPSVTKTHRYKEALLHLLLLETSCFRYWGQGTWTNYANEIYKRGDKILET